MGLILDTSVLVEYERGTLDLRRLLVEAGEPDPVISAITASELLHGLERAVEPRHRLPRQRFVDDAFARFEVVAFALPQARVHARLWAGLLSRGEIIGALDLLIAATAVSLNFRLATLNLSDFSRVPGLEIVDASEFRAPAR